MINERYDITWHDPKIEMPGTDYQGSGHHYLVRYTFDEDEDHDCFYQIARIEDGNFYLPFHNWLYDTEDEPEEELRKVREAAIILHWAYIDHPNEYV
jgi:hypothetical protein